MTSTDAISIPQQIADALTTASRRTGAGFDYLLKTAIRESGLNPTAKAPTSSATGLFQFIEQTWFETVKEAGPRHGLSGYADDISVNGAGRYEVADPQARREILALRRDPVVAATMAGELAETNRDTLAARLGRAPSDGELYIGHFLGAAGAAGLISAAANDPDRAAADMFPAAARSNRPIFFNSDGSKRGAGEVYARLVRRLDSATVPEPAIDRRETVTPFAGIIAFFERLFAPEAPPGAPPASPGPAVPEAAVALRGPDPAPGAGDLFNLFTAPPGGNDGQPAPGDALAARVASDAYLARLTRTDGAPPVEEHTPAGAATPAPPRPSANEPWGGGLFTNQPRAAGAPFVVVNLLDPI